MTSVCDFIVFATTIILLSLAIYSRKQTPKHIKLRNTFQSTKTYLRLEELNIGYCKILITLETKNQLKDTFFSSLWYIEPPSFLE